jgi:hypothetical protein
MKKFMKAYEAASKKGIQGLPPGREGDFDHAFASGTQGPPHQTRTSQYRESGLFCKEDFRPADDHGRASKRRVTVFVLHVTDEVIYLVRQFDSVQLAADRMGLIAGQIFNALSTVSPSKVYSSKYLRLKKNNIGRCGRTVEGFPLLFQDGMTFKEAEDMKSTLKASAKDRIAEQNARAYRKSSVELSSLTPGERTKMRREMRRESKDRTRVKPPSLATRSRAFHITNPSATIDEYEVHLGCTRATATWYRNCNMNNYRVLKGHQESPSSTGTGALLSSAVTSTSGVASSEYYLN